MTGNQTPMTRKVILIDNCAWDVLEGRGVDLVDERGDDLQFTVSELGLAEIPDDSHPNEDARRVGRYARAQLAALEAEPVVWFRFGNVNDPSSGSGGFGDLQADGSIRGGGHLSSVEGRCYADANKHRLGGTSGEKRTGSGLLKNQTDIDYGELSAGHLVITANPKDFKDGARAVDICTWGSERFGDFVRIAVSKMGY